MYGVGKTATKEIVKTAKVVKDTVEEKVRVISFFTVDFYAQWLMSAWIQHCINVLLLQTILGEFSKEQDKFVTENTEKKKKSEVGVAPWIGYNEEEEMKKQILALSQVWNLMWPLINCTEK